MFCLFANSFKVLGPAMHKWKVSNKIIQLVNFKSRNKSKSATFSINWNTFSPANLIINTNYTRDTMSSSALLYNQTSNCKAWNSSSNLHKMIRACRQICITQGFSILIVGNAILDWLHLLLGDLWLSRNGAWQLGWME